jgi:hypothetical protein
MHSAYFETEVIPWLRNFIKNLSKRKRWKDGAFPLTRESGLQRYLHMCE